MNRLTAFGIHLGLSLLIFVVLAYLVVYQWYPGILFETDGGWRGMRIIIGVDLVLGPVLTLAVFKAGKPGLKFDLTAIALLQTVCLAAGTFVVWEERPLGIVYVDSRFEVVSRDDFTDFDFAIPNFKEYSEDNPAWVAVHLPTDMEEVSTIRRKMFGLSAPLTTLSEFYQPFDARDPEFIAGARDMARPQATDDWARAEQQWLTEHGGKLADYSFYTFSTRYVYRYIGFRRSTGENLGFLDFQPR